MDEYSGQHIGMSKEQTLQYLIGLYLNGDSQPTLAQLIEWRIVRHEDEAWLKTMLEVEKKLQDSDIDKRKLHKAKEKAKILSSNKTFVDKVKALRARWNIHPHLPETGPGGPILVPENILQAWVFGESKPSEQEWQRLREELHTELCEPFDLDWFQDEGIIVGAVCFGLTRENIIDQWDRISFTLAIYISPGVTIEVRTAESPGRSYPPMVVTYLLDLLKQYGISEKDLPADIQQRIEYVLKLPSQPSQLLLYIDPTTTHEDVDKTWPQVEWYKKDLWGEKGTDKREWRTYERTTFIWLKVKQNKVTYDAAYNEWLKMHPDEVPVDIAGIKKAVSEINYVWSEQQEK
jgi:hypothetical protein